MSVKEQRWWTRTGQCLWFWSFRIEVRFQTQWQFVVGDGHDVTALVSGQGQDSHMATECLGNVETAERVAVDDLMKDWKMVVDNMTMVR